MLNLFDNIICLNLPDRADRKARSKKEFEKAGLNVDFFRATKGGVSGFCMSMFNVFQKHDGPLLVFEDDVRFIQDSSIIEKAVIELPEDWSLLYLGANCREPLKKYSDHLQVLTNAWTTHAVAYSADMVKYLRENWDGKYVQPFVFDEWLRQKIQPNFKCFITDPMVCTQYNDYSDIWKRHTNYNVIEKSQRFYESA
jgi:hypothetical protein